jgi:hypothetical protein
MMTRSFLQDRKWQLKAHDEAEWRQWVAEQKQAAGIVADTVYVQVMCLTLLPCCSSLLLPGSHPSKICNPGCIACRQPSWPFLSPLPAQPRFPPLCVLGGLHQRYEPPLPVRPK